MSIEKTADAVFDAVKSYLEKRLQDLPAPRDGKDGIDGAPGQNGMDGADGKPGEPGERGPAGEKGMDGAPGERGEKGLTGDRGEPGEKGEKGDPGERGEKGDPGEKGEPGIDGKEGPAGRDGVDGINGKDGAPGIDGKDGAPGEKGADGIPGRDGVDGKDGAPGLKGMDGEPGRDGRDGPPGRDAAQLDILPSINEERSYARGTFASHKGGLWRATRSTEGMDGWECIVEGIAEIRLVQGENSKAFALDVEMSSGKLVGKSFFLPAMIYRGVFREGEDYTPGDTVTWGGSLWHCNEPTKDKPIDGGKSWVLAAKRGRDGKDGRDGIDKTAAVKL